MVCASYGDKEEIAMALINVGAAIPRKSKGTISLHSNATQGVLPPPNSRSIKVVRSTPLKKLRFRGIKTWEYLSCSAADEIKMFLFG